MVHWFIVVQHSTCEGSGSKPMPIGGMYRASDSCPRSRSTLVEARD